MKTERRTLPATDISELPKPRPGRSGFRLGLLAVLALLVVSAAAYWLTRDDETREALRKQAVTAIDKATEGTPLAGVSTILTPPPPPPPPSVLNPPTAPGTLSGPVVQGATGTPVDTSMMPGAPQDGGPQVVAPKVVEDTRVRFGFVDDLAAYLVESYTPGARGGSLTISPQSLNSRYGVNLTGLDGGAQGGREGVLHYAFHPTMLHGLYNLYVERFLEAVTLESQLPHKGRTLTQAQARQMYMVFAGRLVTTAAALDAILKVPDLRAQLDLLQAKADAVRDIGGQMTGAVYELDNQRQQGATEAELAAAQLAVDSLGTRYRKAVDEQAAVRRDLVNSVRTHGAQGMDEDTVLFMARWVDRRLRQNPDAQAAVQAGIGILRDLGRRFAQGGASGVLVQPRPAAPQQPAQPAQAPAGAAPAAAAPPQAAQGAPALPAASQLPARQARRAPLGSPDYRPPQPAPAPTPQTPPLPPSEESVTPPLRVPPAVSSPDGQPR